PLRLPTTAERIDPPLVDVFVTDGRKDSRGINEAEAQIVLREYSTIPERRQLCRSSSAVNCTDDNLSAVTQLDAAGRRPSSEVQLIALDVRDIPVISAVHQNRPHLFRRLDETPHHNP